MANRFINDFWLLALEMYYQKKEGMFVIVLAFVVLFSGLFFWSDDNNEMSLTGAAVSNVGNVVAVPDVENSSVEEEVVEPTIIGVTLPNTSSDSYVNKINNSSQIDNKNSNRPVNIELDTNIDTSLLSILTNPITNPGFETGTLSGWSTGGDANWAVQTTTRYEG